MHSVTMEQCVDADVFIAAAAVADYRPEAVAAQKIKKQDKGDALTLKLTRNPDILAAVAASSARPTLVVGFAAETEALLDNARTKLDKKSVDLIIANDVSRTDIGFNSEQNQVVVVSRAGAEPMPLGSKLQVAQALVSLFAQQLNH